jgi:limonene-1,2-epoxide hydrolase
MGESAESVVRAFLEAWKEPQIDDLMSFFSDDATYVDGPRGVFRGRDAIRSELEAQLRMGFSVQSLDVTSLVADRGTVMLERNDKLTVAGQPFAMELMAVFEIDPSGRIERWREYYDLKSATDPIKEAGFRVPS